MLTEREILAVNSLMTWLSGRDARGRPANVSNQEAKAAAHTLATSSRKAWGRGWSGAHVDRWFPDWIITAEASGPI